MKRNRKGIALFLALSLMAGSCSLQGCSSSAGQSQESNVSTVGTDGGEPYTIVYAFDVWMQQPDWDLVEENLNKLVEEKIGARVELLPMTGANYDQQINLMISSGEKLDLYNASARTTFTTDVSSNKIMGLDEEMVKQHASGLLDVEGDFIKATTINGKIYGFPTIRDMANAYGLIIRDDIAQKYGVEINDKMGALTVDQVDELFAKIKEGEPDMYVTQPQGQTTSVLDSFFKQHDSMGDDMGVLLDHGQGSLKLVNLFETPYYEDAV